MPSAMPYSEPSVFFQSNRVDYLDTGSFGPNAFDMQNASGRLPSSSFQSWDFGNDGANYPSFNPSRNEALVHPNPYSQIPPSWPTDVHLETTSSSTTYTPPRPLHRIGPLTMAEIDAELGPMAWASLGQANMTAASRGGASRSQWSAYPSSARAHPFESQSWDNHLVSPSEMSPSSASSYPGSSYSSPLSPFFTPSPSPSLTDSRSTPGASPPPATAQKMCSHCSATSTPLWRREPTTLKPLCNACGLYLQQRNKLRPQELIDADADDDDDDPQGDGTGNECTHCKTRHTSVWRRSKDGAQLCNACGVYARLRGKDRPLSLKRNKIRPRSKHVSTK